MKKIIIASMDRNGVIGRTSKVCPTCAGRGQFSDVYEAYPCWACREEGTSTLRGSTGRVPANDVPWSYPEIDAHFDRMTMGHAVIMGRRTWEARRRVQRPCDARVACSDCDGAGCPWIAQERHAMVVSPSLHYSTSYTGGSYGLAKSVQHAFDQLRRDRYHSAYIIGGARLFRDALPLADELDLTFIDKTFEGDIRFPDTFVQDGCVYDTPSWDADQYSAFECVECRSGTTPELMFTRWVRR